MPFNNVSSLVVDDTGNKWMGITTVGLVKFDGTNWTTYNKTNFAYIPSLAITANGNIWVGGNGIAKFDGTNWTVYSPVNSQFPSNVANDIAVGADDTVWAGTNKGLAKFNGIDWTVYNTANSGISHNLILTIAIDAFNNKWIGAAQGGLNVYKEGGVILSTNGNPISFHEDNIKLYPNPFAAEAILAFDNPNRKPHTFLLYNLMGQQVAKVEDIRNQHLIIKRDGLPNGIYFYSLISKQRFISAGKLIVQ
ncbi:MAG: T9SS type A sorting domain-containing protein [Bacteroidetes bacterium]|nr:T9SS type A sorting domain-containing protein [Bacteroidota bacterium]